MPVNFYTKAASQWSNPAPAETVGGSAGQPKIKSVALVLFCLITAFLILILCSKSSFLYPLNDWVDANCFFTVGKSMVISLRNPADAFYQTVRAFNLAEKYQIPVILLSDQYLGDASSTAEPFEPEKIKVAEPGAEYSGDREYLRYKYTENGISPRLIPGKTEHLVAIDSDEHA